MRIRAHATAKDIREANPMDVHDCVVHRAISRALRRHGIVPVHFVLGTMWGSYRTSPTARVAVKVPAGVTWKIAALCNEYRSSSADSPYKPPLKPFSFYVTLTEVE